MTPDSGRTFRVEQVLGLLPDVDALAPLRSYIMAASRRRAAEEPHLTVGKRLVGTSELSNLVPRTLRRVADHLTMLYDASIEAIEAESRGDSAGCVLAFLRAGDLEVRVGREIAARVWFEHARSIAERGRDPEVEIEVLQRLAALEVASGNLARAGRLQQRALALAEASSDATGAARAALGLGRLALAMSNGRGAAAWFARGFTQALGQHGLLAELALGMSAVALAAADTHGAESWLRRASDELANTVPSMAQVELHTMRARIARQQAQPAVALAAYREALAVLHGLPRDSHRELALRIAVSEFYAETDRFPDAEDELRSAEELAIEQNAPRWLARVYLMLGNLRGRQRDESGFVFYEKAIELSRSGEPSPRLEAESYIAYADFRAMCGDASEARACLERAREILDDLDDAPLAASVDRALERYAMA